MAMMSPCVDVVNSTSAIPEGNATPRMPTSVPSLAAGNVTLYFRVNEPTLPSSSDRSTAFEPGMRAVAIELQPVVGEGGHRPEKCGGDERTTDAGVSSGREANQCVTCTAQPEPRLTLPVDRQPTFRS